MLNPKQIVRKKSEQLISIAKEHTLETDIKRKKSLSNLICAQKSKK
jgi:hypothetical protein